MQNPPIIPERVIITKKMRNCQIGNLPFQRTKERKERQLLGLCQGTKKDMEHKSDCNISKISVLGTVPKNLVWGLEDLKSEDKL